MEFPVAAGALRSRFEPSPSLDQQRGADRTQESRVEEIDDSLRNLVERAFEETTTSVTIGDSPAYRSEDAQIAWARMHDAAKGREVVVLLEMLDGTWLGGESRWKAVMCLGLSLRTPEGRLQRDSILPAIAVEVAIKNRGTVPGDAVRVQRAGLEAIAESSLDADVKWKCMLDALQASRSHYREILVSLAAVRPSSTRDLVDAQPILFDAMVRADRVVDLDSLAQLVRELDGRSSAPDLRRLLRATDSNLSARVAPILADWGDTGAAFEIRRAIDHYSYASDPNVDDLIEALYRLAGPESVDFIVEQFRNAPPSLQEHLLAHSLRKIRALALERAVREIARSADDVDLKNAAEAFLEA